MSSVDGRPRGAPALLLAAGAVLLFVVAVVVTVVQPWAAHDAPAARFVDALSAARHLVRPGDTILVHPPWRDDVVGAIRAAGLVPVHTVVTEAFSPRHGDSMPPLVVVADDDWTLPAVLARRPPREFFTRDGIVVFRVGGDGADGGDTGDGGRGAEIDIGGHAVARLERARVHVELDDGTRVECPYDVGRRRHVCTGLPEWMTVGDDMLTIGGRRERCTWSHPTDDGVVVVDFGVVVASRDGWRLSLALTDQAADNPRGAPVTASLVVDDERADVTVQHERGFHDVIVGGGVGKSAHLAVRLTTPNDGQRHVCFRLQPATGRAP
jgi:hypothetical protein